MSLTSDSADRLLTVRETAKILRLSEGGVYHLISERRIPIVKLSSRCVRISEKALFAWLEGLTQPTSKPGNDSRFRP
jgi:excisionase family DNA binding protein